MGRTWQRRKCSILDSVLDGDELAEIPPAVRERLTTAWQADGAHMRERLADEMERRARRQAEAVEEKLKERQEADISRARQIFAAFRLILQDSLRAARQAASEGDDMLFSLVTEEQRRQRERDVRAMEERLDALDDEERREIEGIEERYRDVKPYVSQVALVFAVSAEDARQWEQEAQA